MTTLEDIADDGRGGTACPKCDWTGEDMGAWVYHVSKAHNPVLEWAVVHAEAYDDNRQTKRPPETGVSE